MSSVITQAVTELMALGGLVPEAQELDRLLASPDEPVTVPQDEMQAVLSDMEDDRCFILFSLIVLLMSSVTTRVVTGSFASEETVSEPAPTDEWTTVHDESTAATKLYVGVVGNKYVGMVREQCSFSTAGLCPTIASLDASTGALHRSKGLSLPISSDIAADAPTFAHAARVTTPKSLSTVWQFLRDSWLASAHDGSAIAIILPCPSHVDNDGGEGIFVGAKSVCQVDFADQFDVVPPEDSDPFLTADDESDFQ